MASGYLSPAVRMPDRLISNKADHSGYASARTVLDAMDRLEDLLQWAERRALAHGIVPPYQRQDFDRTSVRSRLSTGQGSSSSAVAEEGDL